MPSPAPSQWGPRFWFVMHSVAWFYPDFPTTTEMANAKAFYESLVSLLPCPGCAEHYRRMLLQNAVNTSSRTALMAWVNSIHNSVNARVGKAQVPLEDFVAGRVGFGSPSLLSERVVIAVLVVVVLALCSYIWTRR